MKQYPDSKQAQRTELSREALAALAPDADCLDVASSVVGRTCAERWSLAIRSIRVRDADRLYVAGPDEHPVHPDDAIPFEAEPIFPRNNPVEKRFTALLLLIVGTMTPYGKSELRSCGRALWRGRQHRQVITADGEIERVYVPARSQAGLAGLLGCSVRTVDLYLRIARAAGLVDVWQMPKSEAQPGQAGKKHGYAIFRWLGELPEALLRRLREAAALAALRKRDKSPAPGVTPSKLTKTAPPAAPAPAGGPMSPEDERTAAGWLTWLRGRSRAPT